MSSLRKGISTKRYGITGKPSQLEHSPESYTNLGIAFCHQGLLHQAMSCFHDALAMNPDYASAYVSLGTVFKDKGQPDAAETHLRRALKIKPDPLTYSNLLLYMNYNPRYTPQEIFSGHVHFARQFAAPLASPTGRHTNESCSFPTIEDRICFT